MNPDKCQAITKKKKQCSFSKEKGREYCGIHRNKGALPPNGKELPPTTGGGLPPIPKENVALVVKKINALIKRGPKKGDAAGGSIYVYRMARETGMDYWKVGMTEQSVDKRMQQWQYTHKDRVVCVNRYILSKNHLMAERLCHLYLDYCRMNRYPCYKEGEPTIFRSTWYRTGRVVKDEQSKRIDKDERLVAKNKHTEWFACDKNTLDQVVSAIVLYCQTN